MPNFTERISLNSISNTTTPRPSPIRFHNILYPAHLCSAMFIPAKNLIQVFPHRFNVSGCCPSSNIAHLHIVVKAIYWRIFLEPIHQHFLATLLALHFTPLSRSSVASRLASLLKYFQGLRLFQHCSPPHLSQSFPPIQIVMTSKQ